MTQQVIHVVTAKPTLLVLNALDNAVITISDNTQTNEQSNDCTSTFVDTTCSNFKTNQFLATATDASTITGSNTQIDTQANTCTDAQCGNSAANTNEISASGIVSRFND